MKLNIRNWTYLVAISLLLSSCNKDGAGCFDKSGNVKTVVVDLPTFTAIDVASNIDVQILNTGADKVELTTGENLITGISFTVKNGVLKIDNLNTCFWSIGYTHPLVTVRNVGIEKIVQHGYGNVFSIDTVSVSSLGLQIESASGGFDLILEANSINVVSNSLGPIKLTGKVDRLSIQQFLSDGIFYSKDLVIQNCNVTHNGSNKMEINVVNGLTGSINSLGNVYLFGQRPSAINVDITSEGRIIEKF